MGQQRTLVRAARKCHRFTKRLGMPLIAATKEAAQLFHSRMDRWVYKLFTKRRSITGQSVSSSGKERLVDERWLMGSGAQTRNLPLLLHCPRYTP